MAIIQNRSRVGIDISDRKIRLVALSEGARLTMQSFGEVEVPEGIIINGSIQQPDELVQLLKRLPKNVYGKYTSDLNVNIGLPEQHSYIAVAPVGGENKTLTGDEVSKAVPFENDEVYYGMEPVRNSNSVVITAARKKYIDNYLALLKSAGIQPIGLYSETVAITRALLSPTHKDTASLSTVVIDLGTARTTIGIVIGGSIYFTTSYPSIIAGGTFDQANYSGVLQQILHYYEAHFAQQAALNRILLCGSGAYVAGIAETTAQLTNTETAAGDPLQEIRNNSLAQKMEQPLVYTTAIGLALLKD